MKYLSRFFSLPLKLKGTKKVILPGFIVLIVSIFFTWGQYSLDLQVKRNATLALFLSLEIQQDKENDLSLLRKKYAFLLEETIVQMEQPSLQYFHWLLPEKSPALALAPALQVLQGKDGFMPDSAAISQAQKILARAGTRWSNKPFPILSLYTPYTHKHIEQSGSLMNNLDESIDHFEVTQDVSTGEVAWKNSQTIFATILNAWLDCDPHRKKLLSRKLIVRLERLQNLMSEATLHVPEEDTITLRHYADHLNNYATLAKKLSSGDLVAAHEYLLMQIAKK